MTGVEIIATGNELLQGTVENTTTHYIVKQVMDMGYEIRKLSMVRDELDEIKGALCEALNWADLIFITGGLGPTPDDLTREALAEAIQQPLEFRGELWEGIQAYFRAREMPTPPANINQAYLPYGARSVPNSLGTAPGIIVTHNHQLVVALPGPPDELRQMFSNEIKPFLNKHYPANFLSKVRIFKICGLGESTILERLHKILDETKNPDVKFGYLPRDGEVHLILRVTGESKAGAEALLAVLDERIRLALGADLYGTDEETLPGKVGELLHRKNLTLGTAESCTGGLLLSYLTNVPGSSSYLKGGIVAYNNETKVKMLGVQPQTLCLYGAVSPETAKEMAQGARQMLGTDFSLATTGFAGPSGGRQPDTPVGTVYIALATPRNVTARKLCYPGFGRLTIKSLAAKAALDLLRRYLCEKITL